MSTDTDKLIGKTIDRVETPNDYDLALVFKDGTVARFMALDYDGTVGVQWDQTMSAETDKPINGVHCLVCDTEIVSTHRHHWLRCKCDDDHMVFVDGGDAYRRRGWGPKAHFRDLHTSEVTKGSEAEA